MLNKNSPFDIITYNKIEKYIYEIATVYHTDLHTGDMKQALFL